MEKSTSQLTNSSYDGSPPLIDNENPEHIKFNPPPTPTFPIFGSVLSILSLILLAGSSLYFYLQLEDQAWWITLPFLFSVFGAGLGALVETGLLLSGTPFQKFKNRIYIWLQNIRALNIAPVVVTIFFLVATMCIGDLNLRLAILAVLIFLAFGMGVIFYYGPPTPVGALILLAMQVTQIVIVVSSGVLDTSLKMVGIYFIIQSVLQTIAFIVATATPMKSTIFHTLSSISGFLGFLGVTEALRLKPELIASKTIDWAAQPSLIKIGLILAGLLGIKVFLSAFPKTYNIIYSKLSNWFWARVNFALVSQKRFPNPFNLSEIYKNGAPEPSTLQPYYQQHPEYLPEKLAIPAVEKLEGNVTAFGDMVKKVKTAFKFIALMDHIFPQADSKVPLDLKPRMKPWDDGSDTYPRIYTKKIFGKSMPNPQYKKAPAPAIEAYKEGQFMGYLGQYGVMNPFLKKAPDRPGYLVADFRYLEKYETKPDYESYGGKAYFKVNSEKQRLEVTSVFAPHSDIELRPNPMDSTFRHAEAMVLASMDYAVISGKHLAGIHMTYNLLEVVLHNAFDAQGQFNHPIRTFMYLHLFSHELAEELTTEHLVQEGAIFTQIFATTHEALVNHLNDHYHSFEYASDEDFEYRTEIMKMDNGEILPGACITWELEYRDIWTKYTDDIMDVVYENDAAVANDKYVQDMLRGMNQVFFNGLPDRYDDLKTKKGLSRWASDTIHHLVVRHQVYGTTAISGALDPRLSTTQVPKDRGTPGVDEWRSVLAIALATACARFTLLYGEDGEKFIYLLDGVEEKYKKGMTPIFEELHDNLDKLNRKWTKNEKEKEYTLNYFRAIPSDLRTGPGY